MVQNRLGIGKSQAYAFADAQSSEEYSFARIAALRLPSAAAAAAFPRFMANGVFQPSVHARECARVGLTAVADQTRDH